MPDKGTWVILRQVNFLDMSSKIVPDCIQGGGKHEYVDGVCVKCGEDIFATLGWGRFRLTRCENVRCESLLSALAVKCPYCNTKQSPNFSRRLNRFYLLYVEPLRRFLLLPRPSGLSFLEQMSLVMLTMLGVCFSSYIRDDITATQGQMNLVELIAAFVISLIIIPSLFKEPEFMNSQVPFINRLGLALQKGVFSDLIVQGIQKGLG